MKEKVKKSKREFQIILVGIVVTTTYLASGFKTDNQTGNKSDIKTPPDRTNTSVLHPDNGKIFNRLLFEKSPYLLQHATNPVDWHPWGQEAFEKAQKENKPIFLSIGYSTCHWCHVMEHESFEDEDVAKLMNDTFISIKVDREERPDIDNLYMAVCQMMTGSGGWPLTILMTPDKKPFFAGTYFPKNTYYNKIGMMDLIPRVRDVWKNKRNDILESADQITSTLFKLSDDLPKESLGESVFSLAFEQLKNRFDNKNGGFSSSTKFPTPHNLLLLLRYWHRTGNKEALDMVEKTLHSMRFGGIYDHIGYGFHRYATDKSWHVPHFEKMLYDQALIAMAYIETYQATKNIEYARTAHEICAYIMRDMTSTEGGFYTAEDADSEGEEGKFYVWSIDEVNKILNKSDANLFISVYNLQTKGNFDDPILGEKTGQNILHLKDSMAHIAANQNMSPNKLQKRLENIRGQLFRERQNRVHPLKDDKILTDWNGLMIAAFSKAARVFDEPRYLKAAKDAAHFVMTHLMDSNGRLQHRYRNGHSGLPAHVDDYAFFIWGLIELFETTFETDYIKSALQLNEDMIKLFWDDIGGALYFATNEEKDLLVRQKQFYDSALPSGNSIAALNFIRLARITANKDLEEKAHLIVNTFSSKVKQMPTGYSFFLSAYDFILGPSSEVVIAGTPDSSSTHKMVSGLRKEFLPNKIVIFLPQNQHDKDISYLAEFTKYHLPVNGKPTAYVCQNYACNSPTTKINEMLNLLKPSHFKTGD